MPNSTDSAENGSLLKSSATEPAGGLPEDSPAPAGQVPQAAHRLLRAASRLIFKLFNDIRIYGRHHVPAEGAVILAANHPTYLDPPLIMCALRRQVRFLAWERLFRVPILRRLMVWYGTIPVNLSRPGRGSFEAAVRVLRAREVFGIFPEGGRSDFGSMNPLKSGVARLAMITGAPIVPISIIGAHRIWPKTKNFPRPGGPIIIEFHPPIRLDSEELKNRRRDKSFEREIVDKVMSAINQKLLPALRKERRQDMVYKRPGQIWNWALEGLPFFFSLWLLALNHFRFRAIPWSFYAWVAAYAAYCAAYLLIPWKNKWRVGLWNVAPWIVLLGLVLQLTDSFNTGTGALGAAALVLMAWMATFRFRIYRRFRVWVLPLSYAALVVWSLVLP
ncbi:MAG: hypothetical protein A3G41_03895 [Elusimicrobia bacterium RIFCSPLOWO2_12_FULL_59_9]|nr:MAG: hypothetical protein A3G41_03895 [Elusimicrobia bacterium RIFCSPLOWO2_12_FULL_59_9]